MEPAAAFHVSANAKLLRAIHLAQTLFLQGRDARESLSALLLGVLEATESDLGFVTEARRDEDRDTVLFAQLLARPGARFEGDSRLAARLAVPRGLTFELRESHPVWGHVLQRTTPWVDNDASDTPFFTALLGSSGVAFRTVAAFPFLIDADVAGVVALLGRDAGYSPADLERLEPMVSTVATLTHAIGFAKEIGASLERATQSRARRRAIERSLAASNRLLIEAQRLGSMGHLVWDRLTERVTLSTELARLLGRPVQDLSVAELLSLVEEEDRASLLEQIDAAFEGQSIEIECEFCPNHVSSRHMHIKGRLDDEIGPDRPVVFATLQDVTERKELEDGLREARAAAEEANRAKSVFLAKMSHELRTPLNAVIGFSELLEERHFGPLTEKQSNYVHRIHSSGKHLLAIVSDLLDVSRIEAGRLVLQPSRTSVEALVRDALAVVRSTAGDRGIELTSDLVLPMPDLFVDVVRMKQVLYNLLSNALKFTSRGGAVQLRARRHGDELELSVSDSGIGIAEADQDRLFHEFEQVGRSQDRAEGTGLGLALVRSLTEMHGGRVRVESKVGVGSTFYVYLPLTTGLASMRPSPLDDTLRSR